MTTITKLGAVMATCAVDGSTQIVLARHCGEARLTPVLLWRGITGRQHPVELSRADTVSLMGSLVRMFEAEQPEVREWWEKLLAAQ